MGALLIANSASAVDIRPYTSLKLGYNSLNSEYNVTKPVVITEDLERIGGFVGAIAGGVSFGVHDMVGVRAELEYSYTRNSGKVYKGYDDKRTITDNRILANAYVDFGGNNWVGFNPYIGLSLGYGFASGKEFIEGGVDLKANGLVYGGSVGVAYSVTNNIAADLGVRYLMANRNWSVTAVDAEGKFKSNDLSVLFGARYTF
ncbi:MAG: outer membrane beta-barrel protein [Alphaproteobacteria bacterium]|nr:outer membrane beta-barrel protein [Alphaproteobacteria bacterium]